MLVTPVLDEVPVIIPRTGPPKEMISLGQSNNKTLVRINSSSLSVIQECPRKAKYLLYEKWKIDSEAPATVFGSAWHKAMEVFYRGEITERKLPKLEQMELMSYGNKVENEDTDLCLQATRAFLDKCEPLSKLPETDKRSPQNGVWILHHYFKSFIDDKYVAYVDDKGPFIERGFTLKIYEDEFLIVEVFGTIDFVFRNVVTGELVPGDHKTTSSLGFGGQSYFDRDRPNLQYSCYAMGARRVFGIESNHFMVNVAEVKPKPKKGKDPTFPRQMTYRDEDDFVEFTEAMVDAAKNYLRFIKQDKWAMGPVSSCNLFGGCMYKQVCSAPKSMQQTILKNKFTREVAIEA